MTTDPLHDSLVESLQQERESYVRREMPDRVAEVDEQLARLGVEPPKPPPAKPKKPAAKKTTRKTPGVEKAVDK